MKRILAATLTLFLILSSFACAGAETVTLEMFPQKPENVEVFAEIFAKFMEENPDIKLNVTNVADAQKVIVTRVATNDVPDMVNLLPTSLQFQIMQKEGVFYDLTGAGFFDKISPNMIGMCQIDGKIYCQPVSFTGFGLYYNTDIFAAQGLQVPTTADEMFAVCEKLKAAGIQPLSLADKDVGNLQQIFERILAGSVNHDIKTTCEEVAAGNASFATDERMVKYAEFLIKLRDYGPEDSLGVDIEQARSDFAQGKTAMIIDGSWSVSVLLSLNPELKFHVAPFPAVTEETYIVGSPDTAWAISSSTEHFDECMRFLEFFIREDISAMYAAADKNPTVVNGTPYDVEQLIDINAMVAEGKFLLNPSSFWDSSLRSEIRSQVQLLLIDKDVNAFLTTLDQLVANNYNSK